MSEGSQVCNSRTGFVLQICKTPVSRVCDQPSGIVVCYPYLYIYHKCYRLVKKFTSKNRSGSPYSIVTYVHSEVLRYSCEDTVLCIHPEHCNAYLIGSVIAFIRSYAAESVPVQL